MDLLMSHKKLKWSFRKNELFSEFKNDVNNLKYFYKVYEKKYLIKKKKNKQNFYIIKSIKDIKDAIGGILNKVKNSAKNPSS